MLNRKMLSAALVAIGFLLCTAAPSAIAQQKWPDKTTRIIVPFPAGGSTDVVARIIAQRLAEKFGQSFVVENRPGAGGNIGTDAVAKSAPDGYTLAMSTSGPLANNKFLYRSMAYDPEKDLAPVILVGEIPLVFAAHPSVPANDLRELVELARKQPGKLNAGSPGNGTIGHLALERLKTVTRTDFVHVPFNGDAPAMIELVSGRIQVVSTPVTSYIKNIQAGKLKGLAMTSRTRFAQLPGVPTASELGIDLEASVWFALVGPTGMPRSVVEVLNQEVNAIIVTPETRAKLADFGAQAGGGPPERLGSLMVSEMAIWKRVIETSGVKLD
jgi:tripartite-type tricarboxylate transporter receptor subunit TctC